MTTMGLTHVIQDPKQDSGCRVGLAFLMEQWQCDLEVGELLVTTPTHTLVMVRSCTDYYEVLWHYYSLQGPKLLDRSVFTTDGPAWVSERVWKVSTELLHYPTEALVDWFTSAFLWIPSFSIVHRRGEGDEMAEEIYRMLLACNKEQTQLSMG